MNSMTDKQISEILAQVPVDYYQKQSWLQRQWHSRKLASVIGYIRNQPMRVLDVGCNSGWFLNEVSRALNKSECHGIDLFPAAIKYGQKHYPKLKLKLADAQKLPYKDNSFDLIICTEVVEHVVDLPKMLREMSRVAKPGAQVIIEVDSGNFVFRTLWPIWEKTFGKAWDHAHMSSYSNEMLEREMPKAGLRVRRRRFFNLGLAVVYDCVAD